MSGLQIISKEDLLNIILNLKSIPRDILLGVLLRILLFHVESLPASLKNIWKPRPARLSSRSTWPNSNFNHRSHEGLARPHYGHCLPNVAMNGVKAKLGNRLLWLRPRGLASRLGKNKGQCRQDSAWGRLCSEHALTDCRTRTIGWVLCNRANKTQPWRTEDF